MKCSIEVVKDISVIAYDFLRKFDEDTVEDGRYDLEKGIYVNVETYFTQKRCMAKFESHRKYIDIQYLISGKEIITVAPANVLEVSDRYDDNKDIIFYKSSVEGVDYLLTPKSVLLFKPEDAHMPCICVDDIGENRKVVIKIPVELLQTYEKGEDESLNETD